MFDLTTTERAALLIVLLMTINVYALWRCMRTGRLLTALGGLHANTFIMYGLGPLYYIYTPLTIDRYPQHELIAHLADGVGPLLLGYGLWVFAERWLVGVPPANVPMVAARTDFGFHLVFTGLGLIGYLVSQFEFSHYGLGTIFPVLKNLFYPVLILAMLKLSTTKNMSENALGLMVVLLSTVLAIFSPWRSELLMLVVYGVIACWFRLRQTQVQVMALCVGLTLAMVLLPFVQYKKMHYGRFEQDPVGSMIESQSIGLKERVDLVGEFAAIRMNALRELAHITRSLDVTIDLREGETYYECFYQLIPRAVWPDKPSFNTTANRVLSRRIGLVGSEDIGTSWGVCLFAEMAYNFSVSNLIWFVPLVFFLVSRLDVLCRWLYRTDQMRLMCYASLFGMSFTVVGAVYAVTYVLWTFIVLKVIESILYGNDPDAA